MPAPPSANPYTSIRSPSRATEVATASRLLTKIHGAQTRNQAEEDVGSARIVVPDAAARLPYTPGEGEPSMAEVARAAVASVGSAGRRSRPIPCKAPASAKTVAPAGQTKLADIAAAAVRAVPDVAKPMSNSGPYRRPMSGVPWTRRHTSALLGLALLSIGLIYWFSPDRTTAETRALVEQAELRTMWVESNDGRDAAQAFALAFGTGWDPELFFQCVHPDFWNKEGGRSPNGNVQRIVTGFRTIRENAGVLNVANGRAGKVEIGIVNTRDGRSILARTVRLHAEFKNNSARKLTITLVLASRQPDRWALWDLSLPPFLPPDEH